MLDGKPGVAGRVFSPFLTFVYVCLDSFAQAIWWPGVPLKVSTSWIDVWHSSTMLSWILSVENLLAKFGNPWSCEQSPLSPLAKVSFLRLRGGEIMSFCLFVFLRWGFFRRLMVDVAWRKDSWVCGSRASEWIHLEAGLLEMTTSGNGRGKYQVKETRMVSLLAMDSEFFFFCFPANSKVC